MKMKKVTLGFSILAASFLFMGCPKKTANVAPVADTETESSVDAAWATYVITDIDQACGFIGEDWLKLNFYTEVVGQGTTSAIRDPDAKQLVFAWNKTKCLDGHIRDGAIFMYYKKDLISNPKANENSRYYRDFGFVGRIQLANYRVDGWLIEAFDPAAPAYIYNLMPSDNYDASKVPLKWMIAGKFRLIHPTDPSKNMVWDGQLIKTLTNSTDKDIFAPTRQQNINWVKLDADPKKTKGALVTYHGTVSGITSNGKPYKMTIDEKTPLVRDFLCTSDPVANVSAVTVGTLTTIETRKEEHHPFRQGIASFTTGTTSDNLYPRQIIFGTADGIPTSDAQCDNTGEVLIKGISYRVNFRK